MQQKRTKKVGNVRETCKVKESLNSSFLKLDKVDNIGSKGFFGMIQTANKVNSRVAAAQGKQGKQGIWFLLFPDRENTGNFALAQGKILKHRENVFL